jgi:hypothetical protein
MSKSCYLCGATDNLTSDHIPPKVLFPQPRPNDLITTEACKDCNEGFSKDDALLAVWLSAALARSEAGVWVWENKALKSILKRSPALATQLISDIEKAAVLTELGVAEVDILRIPKARLERVLIRISKGLMRVLDSSFDYSKLGFQIHRLWPSNEGVKFIREAAAKMSYFERGASVFRCLYGFTPEPNRNAMFVFIFFDAVGFSVFGTTDANQQSPFTLVV